MTFDPVMASLGRYLRELERDEAFADALEEKTNEVLADATLMLEIRDGNISDEHVQAVVRRIARERLFTEARRAEEMAAYDRWEASRDNDVE